MITTLSRIFGSGIQVFRRNSWVSAATVFIMAITLFMFSGLFIFNFLTRQVIAIIQDKIDVSIYFVSQVDEGQILKARDILNQLPEVERVDFISRTEALERFQERHRGNEVLVQALEELGSNPFQASLNIKAKNASQYAAIATFIESSPFKDQIAKINFAENQLVIERLNRVVGGVQRAGLAVGLVLAVLAILVTFNTIRMAIYSFREEIGIMKLVGASNWFARGPFLVVGILAGVAASLVALTVFWPVVALASPKVAAFIPGVDLYGFVKAHFVTIFGLQTLVGIALGILSSWFAMNKYLKV